MSGIRIFADYWNIEREVSKHFGFSPSLRWWQFGQHIASMISGQLSRKVPLRFDGLQVYASFSTSPEDLLRKSRLEDELSRAPGSALLSEERAAKKSKLKCSNCGELVAIDREKSVDVRLAVDVIKAASVPDTEIIAVASADEDFLPLLEYVRFVGKKLFIIELPNTTKKMKDLSWGTLSWGNTEAIVCRSASAEPAIVWDSRVDCGEELKAAIVECGELVRIRDVKEHPLNGKEVRALMRAHGWPFAESSDGRDMGDFEMIARSSLRLTHPIVLSENLYMARDPSELLRFVSAASSMFKEATRK